MMEGEDETETGRRSIPSLAHALEEARARAKSLPKASIPDQIIGFGRDDGERYHDVEARGESSPEQPMRERTAKRRTGSLLDLAAPSSRIRSSDKIETARLAIEANAARRALSSKEVKASSNMEESVAEIRTMLDECLIAVRECREMVRALVARRDRNYF